MSVKTEKKWYIDLDGVEEGPFSLLELKRNSNITPDTLVWREGMDEWTPVKKVPELQELFEEEEEELTEIELTPPPIMDEEVVLDIQREPPFFLIWLIVVVLIIAYVLYTLY